MPSVNCEVLKQLCERYKSLESISLLAESLPGAIRAADQKQYQQLIAIYNNVIPVVEQQIFKDVIDEKSVTEYQKIFREMESIISVAGDDLRHKFVIAIPVADRPRHLESCLNSILNLCEFYQYGGFADDQYRNIRVVIADDSQQRSNIDENQRLADSFSSQGLKVEYFGMQQQKQILNRYENNLLTGITGDIDPQNFYHKGASVTRNITYLKLFELSQQDDSLLFYFIDSDQEFQVSVQTPYGDKNVYAVNYFYYLDKIFSADQVSILTGKVVGDPPVSPSVMAGNFLEDVISFISAMAGLKAEQDCQFHINSPKVDDASYHDMADMFGFKQPAKSYQYQCKLKNQHDHAQCFIDFSGKLKHFFDGEHPTRKSYYEHEDVLANIKPARTIYTGNYIFKAEGLKYFIPFAKLKLRMAGPVLGRIIKADIAEKFVSANLPMLHKRTVSSIGQSEFRPGINRTHKAVDLSGEFVRQFFGDVMLFSMEKLTAAGYPEKQLNREYVSMLIQQVTDDLQIKYRSKHTEIIARAGTLQAMLDNQQYWWNNLLGLEVALQNFAEFLDNINLNFGAESIAYKAIESKQIIDDYHQSILDAVMSYHGDMQSWQSIMSNRYMDNK